MGLASGHGQFHRFTPCLTQRVDDTKTSANPMKKVITVGQISAASPKLRAGIASIIGAREGGLWA